MGYQRTVKEKLTPYLLFVIIVATISGFLFGYQTAVISGALIFLAPAFHLSIPEQGVVVSMILIGCILGALVGGHMTDRWGRKKTLIIASMIFIIGSFLLSICQSYECLIIGRLISGIGVGIVSVAAPLYISEISPPRHRGMFVSLYQLAVTLGILISFVVNYQCAESANWRLMFLLGAVPAALQFICLFFLPETPSWLFKQGEEKEGTSILQKLRYGKNWMNQIEAMKSAASPHRIGSWKVVFSSKLRFVLLIGVVLSIFQQITGINTVIYYAPKIFEIAGFTSATGAIAATMVVGTVNVLATIISVWLLDRIGRRKLLLVGAAGMAVSLIVLGGAFFIGSGWINEAALVSLMAYVGFFAIGLGPVTWVILSEIYPLKIRSKAMTVAVFANWGFNYLVSLSFLDLIQGMGGAGTFLLYAAITILSFWFVYRFIPETRGKTLEEIESMILR